MLKIFHGPSLKVLLNCNILRSVCDLQKKKKEEKRKEKGLRTRERNFIFKQSSKIKKKTKGSSRQTPYLLDDFRKKGSNRANTTFLNQVSDFPNGSVAHRKMLLCPTC